MIDCDLFKEPVGESSFPRSEHVYLQPNFDLLGEGALREDGLHLWHHCRVDHPSLGADGVHLLSDPRDDGEVLREVGRQDSGDPVGVQVLQLCCLCRWDIW